MEYEIVLDISIWNDDNSTPQMFDPAKAKAAGARGVMVKSSQANWTDQDYVKNWKNIRGVLPRGAYHFFTWDVSPVVQARYFANLLKDDPGELPPALDFEWWKVTPSDALSKLKAFMTELESLMPNRDFFLYTAPGFWNQHGSRDPWWAKFKLWLAHYTAAEAPIIPAPWGEFTMWQYSSHGDGKLYGCESGNVDLNRVRADVLAKMLGNPVLTLEERVKKLEDQMARLLTAYPEE